MIDLVTLDRIKLELGIHLTDKSHDVLLEYKITEASELVMNHYKHYTVPEEWVLGTSPETYSIPGWASAATTLTVCNMFRNREGVDGDVLPDAAKNLIPRIPTSA